MNYLSFILIYAFFILCLITQMQNQTTNKVDKMKEIRMEDRSFLEVLTIKMLQLTKIAAKYPENYLLSRFIRRIEK